MAEPLALPAGDPLPSREPGRRALLHPLDEPGGRVVLECLEDSRMAGPEHYRIWDDGAIEALPTEHTAYAWRRDATEAEIEAAKQRFFDHNRHVQALLRERGFRVP